MQLLHKNGYVNYKSFVTDDCDIYLIVGKRGDGKTYGALNYGIQRYYKNNGFIAYVRRFDDALKVKNISPLFNPQTGAIKKFSKLKHSGVKYWSGAFYPTIKDKKTENPLCYVASLNTWENSKGSDRGKCGTIVFDEFISKRGYLPDEFQLFENVMSSFVRKREGTKIFLLGNPINTICPYLEEFGIKFSDFTPDTVYTVTNRNGGKVRFVYLPETGEEENTEINKIYSTTSSITNGYWDLGEFPKLPKGIYKSAEKIETFGIAYKGMFALCDILLINGILSLFWYKTTFDIIDSDKYVSFVDFQSFAENHYTAFSDNVYKKIIVECITSNRQYFATSEVGNIVKNWWLDWCRNSGRFF